MCNVGRWDDSSKTKIVTYENHQYLTIFDDNKYKEDMQRCSGLWTASFFTAERCGEPI